MDCLLSFVGNTGEQGGLPWMILAIKQVGGPSQLGDGEKSHPKPLRDKDYERYGKACRPGKRSLPRQGQQTYRSSNRRPAPQRESSSAGLHRLNKGLLSAQLLELGSKKYLQPSCSLIGPYTG